MLSNYSSQSKALGTHTMKIAYELSSILPLVDTAARRDGVLRLSTRPLCSVLRLSTGLLPYLAHEEHA
jgi:hypothetical protein